MGLPLLLLTLAISNIAMAHTDDKDSKNFENAVKSPHFSTDFIDSIGPEFDAIVNPQWTKEAESRRICKSNANTSVQSGIQVVLDQRSVFQLTAASEKADRAALDQLQLQMIRGDFQGNIAHTASAITRYWGALFNLTDPIVLGDTASKVINHLIRHPCRKFQFEFTEKAEWAYCQCSEGLLSGEKWRGGEEQATAFRNRYHQAMHDRRARKLMRCNRFYANQFIHMLLIGAGGTESMRVITEEHKDRPDISSFYDAAVHADKEGARGVEKLCLVDRATGGLKHAHWPAHRLFPLMELLKDALNGMVDVHDGQWTERFLSSVNAQKNKRMVSNNNN